MILQRRRFFAAVGICVALFSIFFGFSWKYLLYKILEKLLVIGPNSIIFDLWRAPPTRIIVDFYMFNWTNPEDFRNPDIKPKFQELGPYRFFEFQKKVNIVWNKNNATVSYAKRSSYEFDPIGSRGSLSDNMTTLNAIAVSAAAMAKGFNYPKRLIAEVAMLIYSRDLTLRKTVDELLFSGFRDTLLSAMNVVPVTDVKLPFDKFAYAIGRNESSSYYGRFNVHTGSKNFQDIGQVYAWNYKNYRVGFPHQCSKVRGSAGEFQGPYMKANSTINIFAPEFCRDVPLEFDTETKVDGIRGFRFVAGDRGIDNGTLYPENACLCNGECLPSGVINISSCWFNSPIFLSYPHFYKADPYYLEQVEGLSPNREKHEFHYTLEPETSVGMDIVARYQINQWLTPIPNSRLFHDVRKIMFPLFWAEARTRLTPDLFNYLRIVEIVILSGRILAVIGFVCGLIMVMRHPALDKLKQALMHYLCSESLEAVIEDTVETENNSKNFITNPGSGLLFLMPYKKWIEVENFEVSSTRKSPSNQPLLTVSS